MILGIEVIQIKVDVINIVVIIISGPIIWIHVIFVVIFFVKVIVGMDLIQFVPLRRSWAPPMSNEPTIGIYVDEVLSTTMLQAIATLVVNIWIHAPIAFTCGCGTY